ncbi:MAG: dihydrodipicolinate synthase family protein [Planctomycetota bacterium]
MSYRDFRDRLRTVQLVPITAYAADGSLALDPMRQLIQRLFSAGVRCFIPCAGSAEFDCLSWREILSVIELVRSVVGDQAAVMAPLGRQLHETLQFGRDALQAGADCALIMPLTFPYVSNAGAKDYYRALLDELDAPLLIYKKSETPSDELLLELAEHPRLVGVKYAMNDMTAFQRVVRADQGRIDWYCGSAERFAPYFMLAGAPGYTSGAGNLVPRLTLAMHAAISAGRWEEGMRLQKMIVPIEEYRARAGNSYNITFLKYAIRHTGLDFGGPRPPNRQLTAAERAEVDALMPGILAAEAQA